MSLSRLTAALVLLGAGFPACGSAATALAAAPTPAASPGATGILTGHLAEGSLYDQIWSVPTLYKNARNPLLEELAIQGQLQTQYAHGTNGDGSYGSEKMPESNRWGDTEVRRFRLGLKALMFNNQLKFHSLLDIDPDFSPRVYQRIAEMYFTYAPSNAFNLSVGKTELKFTREQEISSREILPFERSQLVNMFYGGELSGAWVNGKDIAGGWLYELGAYSNERVDEFPHFHGGTMILAKTGYNYTKGSGFDYAQAEFHYLHNTEPGYVADPKGLASPLFTDCVALSNELTKGRCGLATECFWGAGQDRPNVGGISAMPSYFLTEKLQLVTTFQFAASSGDNGICLPTRYELQVPGGKNMNGDTYFAGYAGLNYYFYGHKLKVMSGVKYSSLSGGNEDFSGWTWLAGFRTAF
jgi:phosphate-selective porin OprO/OprP